MNQSTLRSSVIFGCVTLTFLLTGPAPAFAQYVGSHTYHRDHGYVPHGYGGYGYRGYGAYGGGVNAAGSAMLGAGVGTGAAAQGIGQMNESNAQAQVLHQQAANQYIKNVGLAQEETYEMKDKRQAQIDKEKEQRKAKEKKHVAEHQAALEKMAAAHRLTAEQFADKNRGILHWPMVLRAPQYASLRMKIDQLYDARTPEDSGKGSSGFGEIELACAQMLEIVKKGVRKGMSITDYVTAKHFITSIEYEAHFKVKPVK